MATTEDLLRQNIEGAKEDLEYWSDKLPKVNDEAVEKAKAFFPYYAGVKVGGDLLDQTLERIKVDERKDAIWSKQKTNFDIDKNNLMVGRELFREGAPQVTRIQSFEVPQWKEPKPLDAEESLKEVGAVASNLQGMEDYKKFREHILGKYSGVLKSLRDILG